MLRRFWSPAWDTSRNMDWIIAIALVTVGESEVWLRWHDGGPGGAFNGSPLSGGMLIALATAPVAWRRSHPLLALTVSGGALSALAFFVAPVTPLLAGLLPLLVLTYSVAVYAGREEALAGLVVAGVTIGLLTARIPEMQTTGEMLFGTVVILGTWLLGQIAHRRERQVEQLADRAVKLEQERDEQTRTAIAEERARIARELHDVVAHSVSVMVVQAGAARVMLDASPDRAQETLRSIEGTGREALAELRRLLGLLRSEADGVNLAPQPRMSGVDALIAQFRDTGLAVDLRIEGAPHPMTAGLELTAYRIIQEALTNVLKHAKGASAAVCVRYEPGSIRLQIEDDGLRRDAVERPGHGLIGMRERVTLYGGRLDAGPQVRGGYRVSACLPIEPDR